MKCSTFRERAFEAARADLDDKLTDHLAACAGCREWNDTHTRVASSLATLAGQLRVESAGAEVETRLLASFREQRRSGRTPLSIKAPSRARWHLRLSFGFAVGLATAAALVLAVLRTPPRPTPADPAPIATTRVPAPQIAAIPSVRPALPRRAAPRPAVVAAPHATPTHSEPTSPPAAGPVASDAILTPDTASLTTTEDLAIAEASEAPFIVLQADDTMMDEGQVIRVELSPERARSAGLRVDPRAGRASIRADVVVGHDGVARTIRIPKDR